MLATKHVQSPDRGLQQAEAELVRIIYDMYVNGYSSPQIAEILTQSGVPTATNQTVWSSGGVLGILRNEKYCGNVLCQKTMTVDVFSHKAIKNTGQKPQRQLWQTTSKLLKSKENISRPPIIGRAAFLRLDRKIEKFLENTPTKGTPYSE